MAADSAVAELIREVLAEELARLGAGVREERVRIANDADLAAFAMRMLVMADDREARKALETGNLVFRLEGSAGSIGSAGGPGNAAGGAGAGIHAGGTGSNGVERGRARGGHDDGIGAASTPRAAFVRSLSGPVEVIERGLLSERHVDRLPRETARVRLGPHVRMTPLARDRLRRRGIAVERTE